jgi:hypothetical protein
MKFSKMLAASRAGKQLGPVDTRGVSFPTRDPNYHGGYYARAHGSTTKNTSSFYKNPEFNKRASGNLNVPNTTHPISPARHGPKGDHSKIGAPQHGGGKVGNPNHDPHDGRFTSA